jgi:hypothetical protein
MSLAAAANAAREKGAFRFPGKAFVPVDPAEGGWATNNKKAHVAQPPSAVFPGNRNAPVNR